MAVIHWVMAVDDRQTGWLTPAFHAQCREALLHTMVRCSLLNPVYCLMPDHAHFVWMGIEDSADLMLAAGFFRRQTNILLAPFHWQREAYDHVLRASERKGDAFCDACGYVLEHPVRKQLCVTWQDYPYSGAILPGYPDVDPRRSDFWDVFWKIYGRRH
jgi:REP element-mobilizing transposase RayT